MLYCDTIVDYTCAHVCTHSLHTLSPHFLLPFLPDLSDDDNQSQSSLTDSGRLRRRQLPTPPTDASVPVASTPTVNESELQRCFSMERKDIEDMFKMEIAQLEDSHIRDKNNLLKGYKSEKVSGSCDNLDR